MISTETARIQYTLTSTGQTLVVPFYFLSNDDLKVVKTDPVTFLDTDLVLNSDYTVANAGVPAGGTISLMVASGAVDDVITIYRNDALTQPATYPTSGQFPSATVEQSQDRLTMLAQQVALVMARTLRVPVSNDSVGEMTLAARASKVVGFDSNGDLTYYAFVAGAVVPQSVQGTANQVLVNGGSGSAVTGAVVLTLPQSIGTGSTVRFAKIGINGAAGANSDLTIARSLPAVTAQASVTVSGTITAPALADLHPNAFRDTTSFVPSVAADAYCSFDAQTTLAGTVALNHFRGYQVRHGYTGTGVLGEMSGYMTANMGLSGLGTITFMRGFYVSQPTITGGGTVGQFDGIYMDALTNPTGNVNAIYIAGANRVFMGGGQLVTSIDLTPPAGATTARGAFTFDQTNQTGIAVMNRNATATGTMISFCRDGGTVQGSITQVNNTTVAYNTSSDSRLKTNIRDFTESGSIFDALKPRIFDWGWGGKDSHGFIAQELRAIYPEAVAVGTDEVNAKGDLLHPWGVDLTKLMPVVIAEVKDLRRRLLAAGIAA